MDVSIPPGGMEWQVQQYPEFMAQPIFQRWMKILKDLVTTNASIRGGLGLYINSAFSILGIYPALSLHHYKH